ncbi:hypothetical protein JOC94_004207 [Bacillus thermophilus]|uniref:Uncharacterized protein n=1 Tax=Siminovitchia thermophila TaxID=1245522 RepID=A0ABS2RC02_9BACI|nr:hypothetical protein [Siminovitchia thermophila]MBM7717182.1 hypothetical protein [Siminovitchia thermophila]
MPKLNSLVVAGAVALAALIGVGVYKFTSDISAEAKIQAEANSLLDGTEPEIEPADAPAGAEWVKDYLNWPQSDVRPPLPEIEEYDKNVVWKSGYEVDGKGKLKKLHDYYNQLLGWEKGEQILWDTLDPAEMADYLLDLHDFVEPSKMDNDLKNAEALLELAFMKKDEDALHYVHRILHDLDHHINGTKVKEVWGVTDAFDGDVGEVTYHLLDSAYFETN